MRISPDADRLPKLRAELAAIELWDSEYYRAKVHDKVDDDALRARRKRREEVLGEMLRMVGTDPRTFRLSFRKAE